MVYISALWWADDPFEGELIKLERE